MRLRRGFFSGGEKKVGRGVVIFNWRPEILWRGFTLESLWIKTTNYPTEKKTKG